MNELRLQMGIIRNIDECDVGTESQTIVASNGKKTEKTCYHAFYWLTILA